MTSTGEHPTVTLDHPGFVVTDIDAAQSFFIDVLGGTFVRGGEFGDAETDSMTRLFAVDRAAGFRFAFIAFGDRQVELLEWSGPGRDERLAGNSDVAGRHLALKANDFETTLSAIEAVPGAVIYEKAPRGFVYITLPFGLELQLMP